MGSDRKNRKILVDSIIRLLIILKLIDSVVEFYEPKIVK